MEDLDTVVFRDENGDEIEFDVLDFVEVNGREYVIVATPDNDEEAFILRVETDAEGNETYVTIEDDDEWEAVAEAYEEMLSEEEAWEEQEAEADGQGDEDEGDREGRG